MKLGVGGCVLCLAVVVLAVAACSTHPVDVPPLTGSGSVLGTSPTGGVVLTMPGPTPTPTPTPGSPTPSPGPTPTPTPRPGACNLPPSSDSGCQKGEESFLQQVEAAIDKVVAEQPSLFDLRDAKCSNCYRVLNGPAFTDRLVANLRAVGLCAIFDGEEAAVKNTNDFSDQYDVLTAEMYLRRGDGAYQATCRPAAF
jgi:hypothetical protein